MVGWKSLDEWPDVGMEEDCAELHKILSNKKCSSLQEKDVLSWSPNPKGVFTVASGYQRLLSHKLEGGGGSLVEESVE